MEEKTTTLRNSPAPMLGWLIAPLAVMLAIAAIMVAGFDFDLNLENMTPMLLVAVAATLGITPRVVRDNGAVKLSSSALSLATLGAAMVGHQAIIHLTDQGAFMALQFLVVAFGVFLFDSRGRHEFATMLTFAVMGINVGMVAVGSYNSELDTLYTFTDGSLKATLNLQRQALGYVFFSYLTIFVVLGLLTAVLSRGTLNPAGEEGWFSKIAQHEGSYNKSTLPLQIAAAVWILAHVGSLYHFDSVSMADKLGVTDVDGYHGHFGFWGAFFTGMVAMVVAGMAAEKWYTRSMFIGSMWTLYLVSSWYEAGIWESEQLEGTWGSLIWLGFTFFICVGIYMISTHEKHGGWANLDDHEVSGARKFWDAHWSSLMIGMAFFFGLVIRIQWYIVPSMNAVGTGDWDMTGGSDPWYMKRVVDYILANNAHLIFDADRAYPLGGVNPRPPLFTWSIALLAMILEPMLGNDAVWYAILGLPAIYGALTIFPIATIAKDNFGKSTGVVAAWLIAFMPAHVSHSTWALADHDAFVMLFISMGFMFWFKAIKYSSNDRLTRTSSPRITSILKSYGVIARERRPAMAFAVLAGVSFGIASLAWKGFVVGPSILFLAYFAQVALNMFRRKDSTSLNSLFLAMLIANLLMALPFYAHPQMNLVLDGTGLQPFLFVLGFTLAIAYVTTGFRDKPWLLVLGTLFVAATIFFVILFVLKQLEFSNAWDVLFTGSGYFTKTKVFGTVAEANAPDRGQLFAQLGPIVLVLALAMGFYAFWSTFRNKNQTHLFFGIWIFTATYMSWTAARFMFNATPAVAVLGAWGIVALWDKANFRGLVKAWKKFGIRTPADRIAGARKAVWRTPSFSAILLIILLVGGQQFTYGLDAAIPGTDDGEDDIDETIYNLIPDALRWELAGFSVLDSSAYSGNWYLGSFGSGFNDYGWNSAYDWMTQQDAQMEYSQRPAFVSWWDYGFQALDTGQHPSVSDNFQSGIPASGNMLLARTQADLISMFTWQLATGDLRYNQLNTDNYELTSGFENIVESHMDLEQYELFETIQEERDNDKMRSIIDDYAFTVIQTNDALQIQETSQMVMASGYHRVDGIADTSTLYYRLYQDGEKVDCDPEVSTSCVDGDYSDFSDANSTFNGNVRVEDSNYKTTHYIFGDYWYTNDLRDEFDSVSTHIHRANTRLALTVQLLNDIMTEPEIVNLYDDLIGMEGYYKVQDYEGLPGDMVERDHEIRYFAIDNRLYPRAGRYTADAAYNGEQPMGIFGAPTILSGQDISTFMSETYETSRGDRNFEMTREEVDEAMVNDFLDQQAGLEIDPLMVQDVRVDHNPAFFDTMLARTYVGYGASSLGVDTAFSNPQPAQHFGIGGTPGSILQNALPMPGAMMNHFVISNWYSEDANDTTFRANTYVKIMKYYSGAEISGQVTMSDDGNPLPGVRLLIERDAYSGEGAEDLDEDTYWIPIGYTDADENGDWSFTAPAGKIRVSAFVGTFDAEPARTSISDGSYMQNWGDMLCDSHESYNSQYNVCVPGETTRNIFPVTAVLGNVANMTWLGDSVMNVTGEQANRTAEFTDSMNIQVDSSGISGQLTWTGDESFEGDAIVDTTIKLVNVHQASDDLLLVTTNGSFSTEETRILQGTGEAVFDENGTFESNGLASVVNFVGTFTRSIGDGRTYIANGSWNGTGELTASWIDLDDGFNITCDVDANDSSVTTMPENETVCLIDDTGDLPVYLIDGLVNANGRFTSAGETILIQEHNGASFEGIGFFEGTGIFNGTGRFVGSGHFSGEMVSPGSFYQTGIVPGEYQALVMFDDGSEVELPETVSVGIDPSFGINLNMPGSLIAGNVTDSTGSPITDLSIFFENVNKENASEIEIKSNETGGYYFGPLHPGAYSFRIDMDGDGYNEIQDIVTVTTDAGVISPISIIPEMFDVDIQLVSPMDDDGENLLNLSNRNITISSSEIFFSQQYTTDVNGVVSLELIPGNYELTDENSESYVIFTTFAVSEDNLTLDAPFSIATTLNGNLRAYTSEFNETWSSTDRIDNSVVASNLAFKVQSEEFSYSVSTDNDGNFSLLVPGDREYQLIAYSTTLTHGLGIDFSPENVTNYDLSTQYLKETTTVQGALFTYDNKTQWNAEFYDGYNPVVVAKDSSGFEWTIPSEDDGSFVFNVANDIYDIFVDDEFNFTSITSANISDNNVPTTFELVANPQLVDITVSVCVSANDTCEDGLSVFSNFSLIPTIFTQDNYYVNSTNQVIENGDYKLSVRPGSYLLSITDYDSDDYSSDFNQFFQTTQIFVDFREDSITNYNITFSNEWLVSGELLQNDVGVENLEFLLYNENDNAWRSLVTQDNGSFAGYVPAGDWLVIVSPKVVENETYLLRAPLMIDSSSTNRVNMELNLVPAMEVSFNLTENLTDNPIVDARVTAVSNDGFGNITLQPSNSTGYVYDMFMPGNYSLVLEQISDDRQWIIQENQQILSENIIDNELHLESIYADVSVQIGGRVYWDINLDNSATPNEYVENVSVMITSVDETINETVATDVNGLWSTFVPIRSELNVSMEKSGYVTTYYNSTNSSNLIVEDEAIVESHEIVASSVTVSGLVTTNMPDAELQLNGSSIILYPETDSQLSPISLTGVYENGELSWDTTLTPGNWIVVVESQNTNENGGGIAIGYLDANVFDGGELTLEMKSGGWLEISTQWTDIELNQYHVGDNGFATGEDIITTSPVVMVVDVFAGAKWDLTFDADGEAKILLPIGDATITSEFTTTQHHQNLEMNYSTTGLSSIEQGITELVLEYTRKINSDTQITILEDTLTNVTYIETSVLNAQTDDESYKNIEFDVQVDYLGTERSDLLEVSGTVASSQDSQLWSIEFYNGTDWVDSVQIDLGVGDAVFNASTNSIDNTTILKARVLLPNMSESISLDDGHKLSIDVSSEQGESSNVEFIVNVPQFYGFELSNIVEQTGVSPGGTGTFSMTIENSGNGDDSYVIEIADNLLEGWTITPPSTTLVISKDDQRTQQFSIFAPEDFTSGEIEATVTITSEDGLTSETVVVEIVSARISLSVDETLSQELTKVYESETGQVVVPITNSGYRTATNVLVSVDLTNDAGNEVIETLGSMNISVAAGQTVNATFDVDPSSSKFNRFAISVEVTSEDDLEYVEDSIEPFDYQEETILDQAEGTSSWFMVIIIVLTLLVGYGGTKIARNKGTNRF